MIRAGGVGNNFLHIGSGEKRIAHKYYARLLRLLNRQQRFSNNAKESVMKLSQPTGRQLRALLGLLSLLVVPAHAEDPDNPAAGPVIGEAGEALFEHLSPEQRQRLKSMSPEERRRVMRKRRDRDNNPPGAAGGPGSNWENPPGPDGGWGASPDRGHRRRWDRDNNPPGAGGGPGTNWENRPGPRGGPGASPNRVARQRREGPSH